MSRPPENSPISANFDELAYLEANPDVRDAVLRGNIGSGYDHWKNHGRAEGRFLTFDTPNIPGAPPEWNEGRYLRANPDVAGAVRSGAIRSGYEHWRTLGERELRPGGPASFQKAEAQDVLRRHPHGVNYLGFQTPPIGLAAASRGYVQLLREAGVPLSLTEVPWKLADLAGTASTFDTPYAVNVVQLNPDVLPTVLSHYGYEFLRDRYNIGVWIWEMHTGYPEWQRLSRLFHEIWVPAEFVATALRPVVVAPLVTIPYVVEALPPSSSLTRTSLDWPESAFVFLTVFDLASSIERKNPLALLQAFRKAFGDRTDVLLVLKYQHGDQDPAAAALLARATAGLLNVRTIPQTFSEPDVHALFRLSDCLVSPHCSEGFGLNIAAAMSYGKPVIATGYSGNLQFNNAGNCFLIDYELKALDRDTGAYRQGYAWARPSVDHLAELLRLVVESPAEAQRRAANGKAEVEATLSRNAVGRLISTRLSEIGLTL